MNTTCMHAFFFSILVRFNAFSFLGGSELWRLAMRWWMLEHEDYTPIDCFCEPFWPIRL
jgi:hypothetical protein